MSPYSSSLRSTNTSLFDLSHLTPDILQTPDPSHGQPFVQNSSLLTDRMRDTYITRDSSPLVSGFTTICTSTTSHYFSPFRTCFLLLSNFNAIVFRMNNGWPPGMLPFYNHNSYLNAKNRRSTKWRTTFGYWR